MQPADGPDMPESDSSENNRQGHDRQQDIRNVAKILREGRYSYDHSAHLIKDAFEKAMGS